MKPYHFISSVLNSNKKQKILLAALSISFIIMIFAAILSFERYSYKMLEARGEVLLNEAADLGISAIDIKTKSILKTLTQISSNSSLSEKKDPLLYIEELKNTEFLVDRKYKGVITKTGELYETSGGRSNVYDQDYFKRVMAGEGAVVDIFVRRMLGTEAVILAVPVHSNDEIFGALYTLFEPEEFENALSSSFDRGINAFIITDDSFPVLSKESPFPEAEFGGIGAKWAKAAFDISVHKPIGIGDWTLGTAFTTPESVMRLSEVRMLVYIVFFSITVILTSLFIFICAELKKHKKVLRNLVYTDQLTGGDNKDGFYIKTKALMNGSRTRYAFVMFDIDRFELINDVFGHNIGDEVIKHMSNVLLEEIGRREVVARSSGDVFYSIMEFSSKEELEKRIAHLSNCISGFKFSNDQHFNLVVCAGVYIVGDTNATIDSMISRAKLALVRAKGRHKNTLSFYNDDMGAKVMQENEILNDMHKGLRNSEFVLYVQPKYDFKTGKISGGEILVRWNHERKGLLSPNKFIPVFEKNGFITEIDMFVFEGACRLQKTLMAEGFETLILSVNQSRLHMHNPNYIKILKDIVSDYNLCPSCIELELTESAFFSNMEVMADVTSELRRTGFRIAMDDFGSGYSSLNMLGDINVDVLKFGQEFFYETGNADRARKIIKSIVQMAKNLGIETVAEGVETRELADFLREIGCDMAQGYYYSRPIPIPDFINMLRAAQH